MTSKKVLSIIDNMLFILSTTGDVPQVRPEEAANERSVRYWSFQVASYLGILPLSRDLANRWVPTCNAMIMS